MKTREIFIELYGTLIDSSRSFSSFCRCSSFSLSFLSFHALNVSGVTGVRVIPANLALCELGIGHSNIDTFKNFCFSVLRALNKCNV